MTEARVYVWNESSFESDERAERELRRIRNDLQARCRGQRVVELRFAIDSDPLPWGEGHAVYQAVGLVPIDHPAVLADYSSALVRQVLLHVLGIDRATREIEEAGR